jgi:hypothetical protein
MYGPDYYSDTERVKKDSARLHAIKSDLEKWMFEWSETSEKLA